MKQYALILAFLLVGCGLIPEKLSLEDPRRPLLVKAISSFDRHKYGFTPITTNADMRLESTSSKKYDAMLHVYTATSRTIALRKSADGNYRWIGEQEIFNGPKQFITADGPSPEQIVLEYQIVKVENIPTNQLVVNYYGRDPRLAKRHNLSLTDVAPIIKEWGY